MRKLFFSIILLAFGLSAFAQTQPKYANFCPAYPPVVGESAYNNLVFNHNGLYLHDIILDSLPHYEIEHIPNQTVRYLEDGIGFYVTADSLHSNNVVYSYEVDVPPMGPFEFNENTGRFKFYPDAGDYWTFNVTFTATSGWQSLSQTVEFDIMPEVVPENLAIQSLGEMPSAQEYTIIAETHTQMFLNNMNRTTYSYSISGKDIVLDDLFTIIREDIYELNLFAERLYIRSALEFPQTNVTIYAREIIFEDNGDEIASINTTPSPIGEPNWDTINPGMNGGNAGNITLFVKDFQADYAKRLILNGAKGQCANMYSTPGNGGNGGVVLSSVDVRQYCDFARGSAGVKYGVQGRALIEHGPVIGAGQAGENGHFELINEKYCWIHPYYISAVIRHINDSYLSNYFSYSKTTANDYFDLINAFKVSDEWENFDETLKVELQDQLLELEGLLYRLNENLDYFGNPLGWAPMLSFEVLQNIYNNEIERAMPTLYLNYWIHHVDQTLANWINESQEAAEQTQAEIIANQRKLDDLITGDIPTLRIQIAVLKDQIQDASIRLKQIEDELMRKARHNVKKRNRINKAFGIFKAALNCIPVFGGFSNSVASTIGTVVDYVANNYFDVADTYGYGDALSSAIEGIYDFNYGYAWENLQQAVNSIDLNNLGQTGHDLSDIYDNLDSIVKPVYTSITDLKKIMAQSSAPRNQIEAEFDRLCSESADYQNIKAELTVLVQNYQEFETFLNKTYNDILTITSEVSNEVISLDAFRRDVFIGNSKRDLQAMQCVEKMKQRAMNRLVKYNYYMRKAYEYRLLKPYPGNFNLVNMYNRIEMLISPVFDNSTPVIPESSYNTLCALFKDDISEMIEQIIQEYMAGNIEVSVPITINVSKECLDAINSNEEYILNLYKLGIFSPEEENIRIVDFGVQYIETHLDGNVGTSTYMNLWMEHNGISRFRKNGEIYWFNHISKSTVSPHTWGIRYDAGSNETTIIEPSAASQSLLHSLLPANFSGDIMLFSRPAAWSDIVMSKNVHSTSGADIIIDSLVLRLQYDFTRRPDGIRNIDIATNNDLLPFITCSETDRNGRSNGKGSFHRSFNKSSGTVTFTAKEKHGTYHFVNWTDRLGNVITDNNALTVNKLTDQFYRANYERRIPVISVADTIYVGCEGGEYEVHIQNVGSGDIEMDWYVSDSLCTWVHLNGITEGIDEGYFTFAYEALRSGGQRIDSLEILAPEIEGMSKMVYIMQYDNSYFEVSAAVDPEGAGVVEGTGFYNLNDQVTLTALPIDDCHFVAWENNGEIVSTQPEYTITVTNNIHFIAHFECENMVSISADVEPLHAGYVTGTGLYNYGEMVTLIAVPGMNYVFDNWSYENVVMSDQATYTFIAQNDMHFVAKFKSNIGVEETETSNLKIYPNPTNGCVTVECENMEYIQVFSIIGSEELVQTVTGKSITVINMNNLPAGLYYFRIATSNGYVIRKIVKD